MEGVTGLFMLYFFQYTIAQLRKIKPFKKIIDNQPLLLMDGSEILTHNLNKVRLTEADLRSKLREANVMDRSDIKALIFETTGDIIVIQSSDTSRTVSSWMLQDVVK